VIFSCSTALFFHCAGGAQKRRIWINDTKLSRNIPGRFSCNNGVLLLVALVAAEERQSRIEVGMAWRRSSMTPKQGGFIQDEAAPNVGTAA